MHAGDWVVMQFQLSFQRKHVPHRHWERIPHHGVAYPCGCGCCLKTQIWILIFYYSLIYTSFGIIHFIPCQLPNAVFYVFILFFFNLITFFILRKKCYKPWWVKYKVKMWDREVITKDFIQQIYVHLYLDWNISQLSVDYLISPVHCTCGLECYKPTWRINVFS